MSANSDGQGTTRSLHAEVVQRVGQNGSALPGIEGSHLRVLAVCTRAPGTGTPASDGSTVITREVLLRLTTRCRLTLAWFQDGLLEPETELLRGCHDVVPLPLASRVSAARGVLSATPTSVLRRSSPEVLSTLRAAALQADVVYLHGLGAMGLAEALPGPVVVNEVDPMSLVYDDLAKGTRGLRQISARVRQRKARGAEERAGAIADEYLVVNRADATELAKVLGRPVRAVPNGVALRQPEDHMPGSRTICFVGALDYPSNIESARVLVDEILPFVRQRVPEVKVVLAGRAAGPDIHSLAGTHVAVLSDVPDVMEVYASAAVAAFPGGHGRGTRNSVLEALRAGVPVVASTVSARGIHRGPHVRVADGAADFAGRLVDLLTQPGAQDAARRAAVTYGAGLPTWDAVALEYLAVFESVAVRALTSEKWARW